MTGIGLYTQVNEDISMESFNDKWDQYLALLPDSPRIDAGSKLHSNELDSVIRNWTWSLGCGG